MRWAKAVASLLVVALLWGSPSPADANCPPWESWTKWVRESVERYDLVAVGRVTGTVDEGAEVKIERYLKGIGSEQFVMYRSTDMAGITDAPPPVGTRGIIFLSGDPEGQPISIDECNPTFRLSLQDEDLVEHLVEAKGDLPALPLAIAAIALPLAFVLAASFVFPAKGSQT